MQINIEQFKEENYSNPRLIEIKNEEVETLYEQIRQHQVNVNPYLTRFEEIETKKAELKAPLEAYINETKQELEDMMEKMKNEDQLASKIKEKLVPLVEIEVMPHLGELDEFVGLEKIDDKMYAKVNDRVEEWIKTIRAQRN